MLLLTRIDGSGRDGEKIDDKEEHSEAGDVPALHNHRHAAQDQNYNPPYYVTKYIKNNLKFLFKVAGVT